MLLLLQPIVRVCSLSGLEHTFRESTLRWPCQKSAPLWPPPSSLCPQDDVFGHGLKLW